MSEGGDEAVPDFILVMGVSGCGKSTVAAALAQALGGSFIEGDSLHPPTNIATMRAGQPLNDQMRLPWLQAICTAALDESTRSRPVVIACSALKRRYRDLLRTRLPGLVAVHLDGSAEVIGPRLAARSGHFMPASLLASQIKDLEAPDADEASIRVDVSTPTTDVLAAVLKHIAPNEAMPKAT
jgi:gluconokinase